MERKGNGQMIRITTITWGKAKTFYLDDCYNQWHWQSLSWIRFNEVVDDPYNLAKDKNNYLEPTRSNDVYWNTFEDDYADYPNNPSKSKVSPIHFGLGSSL